VKCIHTQQSIQQRKVQEKKRDILMLEMNILDQKDLGRRDEMARVLCMLNRGEASRKGVEGSLFSASWYEGSCDHVCSKRVSWVNVDIDALCHSRPSVVLKLYHISIYGSLSSSL
jgi:hypothetical protein